MTQPAENPIAWEPEPEPEPPPDPDKADAADETAPADPSGAPKLPQALPIPEPTTGGAPPWAVIPQGLTVPRGRAVFFARFPSGWTDTPQEGMAGELTDDDAKIFQLGGLSQPKLWRQCIFWVLSIGDQKIALGKANGDPNRFNSELCKQMIRSIDGLLIDRSGPQLDLWWERIGERCRSELTRMCVRIHSLTAQERSVFFACCVASRTAG